MTKGSKDFWGRDNDLTASKLSGVLCAVTLRLHTYPTIRINYFHLSGKEQTHQDKDDYMHISVPHKLKAHKVTVVDCTHQNIQLLFFFPQKSSSLHMEEFMAAAAQVVGGAVLQEIVSRGASLVLGKRKDKASQGHYLERLNKAVHEVEFILDRTAKLPITEVSLLRDRIELKRDFIQSPCLLINKQHKKSKTSQGQQDTLRAVTCSSSHPQGLLATRSAMFLVSSFIAASKDDLWLSSDVVERFEQFADSARNILTRVESSCSLRRWMCFSSPLVRHLFEWKTLIYRKVQEDQERRFCMWPARLEEDRGVEVHIDYKYLDHKRPEKSFSLWFVLRLSESTDIAGVAMDCLQSLASQFKLQADTAMGELTLLANLQDVSHSNAPPWVGIQEKHYKIIQTCRPDPLCCIARGHGPCANNNIVPSELSQVFPEEVILFKFKCYISALEYNLCVSSHHVGKRSVMRNRSPPLKLTVSLQPHYVHDERLQASYAVEAIGDNDDECVDVSIQQLGETVRSDAMNCFLHQPQITNYSIRWVTKHGVAKFHVRKRKHIRSSCAQNHQAAGPRPQQVQRQKRKELKPSGEIPCCSGQKKRW